MTIDVAVMDLGCPATLSVWHLREGELAIAGDRIAEVVIPGATVDIAAPVSGLLVKRLVSVGTGIKSAMVIATMDDQV